MVETYPYRWNLSLLLETYPHRWRDQYESFDIYPYRGKSISFVVDLSVPLEVYLYRSRPNSTVRDVFVVNLENQQKREYLGVELTALTLTREVVGSNH